MKKSLIFLILGIIFFIISFILFATLKEEVTYEEGSCISTCGKLLKYSDVFTAKSICPATCLIVLEEETYVFHNSTYVPFVWFGLISFIITVIIFIFETIKKPKR